MQLENWVIIFLILIAVILSIRAGLFTIVGAITGGFVALVMYFGIGVPGLIMLAAFVLLGSVVTKWRLIEKQNLNLDEKGSDKRTAAQVLANGGVAAILAVLGWLMPYLSPVFNVMVASAFSAAIADTFSSELGTLYGRNFYNIITLQRDERGLDGVVSLEGFLFGLAGSCFIAAIYCFFHGWSFVFVVIVLSGTIGNIVDSILGATMERRRLLNNEAVNFLNTLTGAIATLIFYIVASHLIIVNK